MRLTATDWIDLLVDTGTFTSWDEPIDTSGWGVDYGIELTQARHKAGTDEAVITGEAAIDGRRIALIVSEFGFLAGSIGRAAAERIVAAVHRATDEGLLLVGLPASGGTRLQEGTPAFIHMVDIARAIAAHQAAGFAYVSYLRDPTTGGVMATWGSLGQIVWAEPGALTGFLGPKVFEIVHGEPFPDVQRAEHLANHGVIDGAVPPEELRARLALLTHLVGQPNGHSESRGIGPAASATDAWAAIERTRDPDRPGLWDLLDECEHIELSGTGEGEWDPTVFLGIVRIDGLTCVVAGQDREAQAEAEMGPAALRTARRGARLARELRLPFVTVVDTPGAELSAAAEEGAMAGEIARTLAQLSTLPVHSVSVLLGQGCGGGALAMLPARRVIAVEDAWLTPLPPEGASAIVFGDTSHAAELARQQRVTAADLAEAGFVDRVVTMNDVLPAIGSALRDQW